VTTSAATAGTTAEAKRGINAQHAESKETQAQSGGTQRLQESKSSSSDAKQQSSSTGGHTTFAVNQVENSKKQLGCGASGFLGRQDSGKLEACSTDPSKLISGLPRQIKNGFVAAVHVAYVNHLPLVLSPDMIWLLIAQAFAIHVDLNHG